MRRKSLRRAYSFIEESPFFLFIDKNYLRVRANCSEWLRSSLWFGWRWWITFVAVIFVIIILKCWVRRNRRSLDDTNGCRCVSSLLNTCSVFECTDRMYRSKGHGIFACKDRKDISCHEKMCCCRDSQLWFIIDTLLNKWESLKRDYLAWSCYQRHSLMIK